MRKAPADFIICHVDGVRWPHVIDGAYKGGAEGAPFDVVLTSLSTRNKG